jgi:SPP1 family predicted phage head-tail adaptor
MIDRINPGKMNRVIRIEKMGEDVEPSGSVTTYWAGGFTVRAELVQRQTDDYDTAAGESTESRVTFRVWYIQNITTGDRILYDGDIYLIAGITEIGLRRGLEITAIGQNTRVQARRNDLNASGVVQ